MSTPYVVIIPAGLIRAGQPSIVAYYRDEFFMMLWRENESSYGSTRPWVVYMCRYVQDSALFLFHIYGYVLWNMIFRTHVWAAKMLPGNRVSGTVGLAGLWATAWIFMLLGASCPLRLPWFRCLMIAWWNATRRSL